MTTQHEGLNPGLPDGARRNIGRFYRGTTPELINSLAMIEAISTYLAWLIAEGEPNVAPIMTSFTEGHGRIRTAWAMMEHLYSDRAGIHEDSEDEEGPPF
jgi:hypothetical protein